MADGQRTNRTWMVHTTGVTRGQAGEHIAVQKVAESHRALLAGLAKEDVITKSVALQLAKWTVAIPDEFRVQAEEILVAAARAGAGLRALAAICAEIRARTAPPDPDNPDDPRLDRGVSLDTTIDGAGVVRGDLTPECAALVQAVLDALSAPAGGRTSLAGLQDWCHWHHHVLLHEMGWQLTVHPDGTSEVTSPAGKVIRSHCPPPRSG